MDQKQREKKTKKLKEREKINFMGNHLEDIAEIDFCGGGADPHLQSTKRRSE